VDDEALKAELAAAIASYEQDAGQVPAVWVWEPAGHP